MGLGLTLAEGMKLTTTKPKIGIASRINPAPLTSSSEVPTVVWFALGAIVVGGATYYFMRRRPS